MNSLIGDRFLKLFLRHLRHPSRTDLADEVLIVVQEDDHCTEGETLEPVSIVECCQNDDPEPGSGQPGEERPPFAHLSS